VAGEDALADVIVDVTARWDVPLMVSRGQSSATFLHSAKEAACAHYAVTRSQSKIYALYDFDPGGHRASSTVERELTSGRLDDVIEFEHIAVTPAQIAAPAGPPAEADGPRGGEVARGGQGRCVERDAIDPDRLCGLVEDAITSHIDEHEWRVERAIEAEEREGLLALRDGLEGNGRCAQLELLTTGGRRARCWGWLPSATA
jgi:hypothetical protein